jgi:hypothetical protein
MYAQAGSRYRPRRLHAIRPAITLADVPAVRGLGKLDRPE